MYVQGVYVYVNLLALAIYCTYEYDGVCEYRVRLPGMRKKDFITITRTLALDLAGLILNHAVVSSCCCWDVSVVIVLIILVIACRVMRH